MLLAAGTEEGNGVSRRVAATRIVDLEDPTFSCEVNQFPIELVKATGGLIGQTPFVCGGMKGHTSSKACYVLEEENGEWKEDHIAALNGERSIAATGSVIINDKLVLAGGFDGIKEMSTIEMVAPNTRSSILPIELPFGMSGSCIVPWDNNTFLVIGGGAYSGRKETYFLTAGGIDAVLRMIKLLGSYKLFPQLVKMSHL